MSQDKSSSDTESFDIAHKLLKERVISSDQLEIVKKEQIRLKNTKTIGAILVSMGFITEKALGEVLNQTTGVKKFDLKSCIVDPDLTKVIPKTVCVNNNLIPLFLDNKDVTIAMSDIFDIVGMDRVKKLFPSDYRIKPVYAATADILNTIDQYYDYEMSIDGILREIESGEIVIDENSGMNSDNSSPMVRLVNAILTDAVHKRASDIHFEPENYFLRIRYRIDGKMVQVRSIHKDHWRAIAVRLKIISDMNIAESRKPQDGRIESEILGRKIDFRVSSQPTVNGENIVMRILDESQSILSLKEIGMNNHNLKLIDKLIKKPNGVVIITGPTGSGKTTTLYTILSEINSIDKNIMTLENPVEYHIPLIRQSNIKEDVGMSFGKGIESIMRQDPDVILIGEIRNKETAIAAIQSAMTGHQVFSSLHTNDALSAIARLENIGVPTYLLSGAIICVIAQRLARKLCGHCKIARPINDSERRILRRYPKITHVSHPKGCSRCQDTGYYGRSPLMEILPFDKKIDDMILSQASRNEVENYAKKMGFMSMADDGILKVAQGVTTLDEVAKVVDMTDYIYE
ncbi:GspE/PulE family protein [Rickettsiales bacterium]|nr:GspE/PulE family protein [Rickettsiales bacterium]MDB2550894.1 GspE/PulE family protein [Rickettsiales bacterium]